jgi:hypothetical protein
MQYRAPPAGFNQPHSGIEAMRGLGANLSHLLRMTRALVTGGREVDLKGLEHQVGLLCAKTLDLPPEEGRELRPVLAGLLADLDSLSVAMVQHACE